MTTLAHRPTLGGPRNGGVAARRALDPLGRAHVSPRVAAAAPGADAPHRRGRGRDRQHHDRLQRELPPTTASSARPTTCSRSTAPIRASSRPGSTSARKSFGTIDVIGHRSVRGPRRRRDGGLTGHRIPTAPTAASSSRSASGSYPAGPRSGRRHRRRGGVSATRDRVDPGARRAPADRRRHRREPAQAERRVRSRLPLVRGARTGSRCSSTRRRRRSTPSTGSLDEGDRSSSAFAGSMAARERRQRCGGDVGDVLRGHRLPAPGLAGRRRRLRSRRAATAPPARHARRHRRDAEAPSPRAAVERRRSSGRSPRSSGRSPASRSGSSSPRHSSPRSTIASTGSAFRGV